MKALTTEEFVKKAIGKHGTKYDYSDCKYTKAKVKVCIRCPIHGEFWQLPYNHLMGSGCKNCAATKHKLSDLDFISRATAKHGDLYDYSKVTMRAEGDKVEIMCPIHGSFLQNPSSHLTGAGCPGCFGKFKKNKNEFMKSAREIHGTKYIILLQIS